MDRNEAEMVVIEAQRLGGGRVHTYVFERDGEDDFIVILNGLVRITYGWQVATLFLTPGGAPL